jgi:hypothetical protein
MFDSRAGSLPFRLLFVGLFNYSRPVYLTGRGHFQIWHSVIFFDAVIIFHAFIEGIINKVKTIKLKTETGVSCELPGGKSING